MTSYVEITLWGGLSAPKKETVEGAFLPDPGLSIMAANLNAPAQTFFNILSRCQTVDHLFSTIDSHYRASRGPLPQGIRYYNPTEYRIIWIAVLKQRFVVQHEGFVFRVHHQPLDDTLPAEPDFLITIDRSINATIFSTFTKFAIDRVNLVHPITPDLLEGTFRRPVVWRMPAIGPPPHDYTFNLDLLQVCTLFEAVQLWSSNYHVINRNCFWQSRIIRTALREIIQAQQLPGVIVIAHEPDVRGATLGKCFGLRLDPGDQGETTTIINGYRTIYDSFQID